jgi:porin
VQAGVFEGNVGEESGEGRHGLDWNLHRDDGVLVLTEVAYMLNGEKNAIGLRGVYKLGAFYHSPQDNDAFPSEAFHSDAGGYAIIDQQLWRKPGTDDQGLSGFLRIGGAPDDRNGVPFYFDTGFDYKGLIPGRDKDVAGIGFSYTNLSRDLRDDDGEPFAAHHESILEATYKIQVKDWLYVQPDFQYIFNPGGDGTLSDAVVAGIRFNVTF